MSRNFSQSHLYRANERQGKFSFNWSLNITNQFWDLNVVIHQPRKFNGVAIKMCVTLEKNTTGLILFSFRALNWTSQISSCVEKLFFSQKLKIPQDQWKSTQSLFKVWTKLSQEFTPTFAVRFNLQICISCSCWGRKSLQTDDLGFAIAIQWHSFFRVAPELNLLVLFNCILTAHYVRACPQLHSLLAGEYWFPEVTVTDYMLPVVSRLICY